MLCRVPKTAYYLETYGPSEVHFGVHLSLSLNYECEFAQNNTYKIIYN